MLRRALIQEQILYRQEIDASINFWHNQYASMMEAVRRDS